MGVSISKTIGICAGFVLCSSFFAVGQVQPAPPPREVQVCELLRDPLAFDKQVIRFRGRLLFEFEGSLVDDHACELHVYHPSVWWIYGANPLPPSPRKSKVTASLISPILRDEPFDKFDEYRRLRRSSLPDGGQCTSHRQCAYYDVVATFTGRFFSGEQQHGHVGMGGYGHMGCCHLFVIEQISDVDAIRTAVPPDDQAFSCTTSEWQSNYPVDTVSSIEDRWKKNREFLQNEARSHGDASLTDMMQSDSPWLYMALTGSIIWSAPDLQTTYTARFPQPTPSKKRKEQMGPRPTAIVMNVSRERCQPAEKSRSTTSGD